MPVFRTCSKKFRSILPALFYALLSLPLSTGIHSSDNPIGGDFILTDQHRNTFNLKHLRGSVVLLFFGYTSCPDVCPMEFSTVSSALNLLKGEKVKGVFVTVDPKRDNPDRLKSYVGHFHPDIYGLTGTLENIKRVAETYQVRFEKTGSGDNYTIDHSVDIYILGMDGVIQSIAPFGATPSHLERLVRQLLGGQ